MDQRQIAQKNTVRLPVLTPRNLRKKTEQKSKASFKIRKKKKQGQNENIEEKNETADQDTELAIPLRERPLASFNFSKREADTQ